MRNVANIVRLIFFAALTHFLGFGVSQATEVVGKWRIYSDRIFYDAGGGGSVGAFSGRTLDLLQDGTWNFGPSSGTFSVEPILEEDWKQWGIEPYGPVRKLVLNGWGGTDASGPIEESEERIDFLWVIYHVEPPIVIDPGMIWIKFGR